MTTAKNCVVVGETRRRKLYTCGTTLVVCKDKKWQRVFKTVTNCKAARRGGDVMVKLGSLLPEGRDVRTVCPV